MTQRASRIPTIIECGATEPFGIMYSQFVFFFISGVFIFVQPLETDILIYNNLKRIGFYFSYTKKSDSVGSVAQKCQDP